jgi:hypothetical protein
VSQGECGGRNGRPEDGRWETAGGLSGLLREERLAGSLGGGVWWMGGDSRIRRLIRTGYRGRKCAPHAPRHGSFQGGPGCWKEWVR